MNFIIFVPGHTGIKGNERANILASKATTVGGRTMDSADILNTLRDTGHDEISDSELDFTCLT